MRLLLSPVAFVIVIAVAALHASGAADDWLPFLMNNRFDNSFMPRSYSITPADYFEKVPETLKEKTATEPRSEAGCNNEVIPVDKLNAYTFQTEKWLSTMGTNIYDAAVWCLAITKLGQGKNCTAYMDEILVKAKTIQFTNIRGTAPCKGVEYFDQCTDNCGFCYGDNAVSLEKDKAYFFRMISDYWSIQGTVDARCPHLNNMWTWNDYKPVLGENAWAVLLGPAQHAMMMANFDAKAISDDHPLFKLGIPFLDTLDTMKVGNTGAYYYTAWNTWFGFTKESKRVGATFSIENMASLTAGLEALQFILQNKPASRYYGQLNRVMGMVTSGKQILQQSWDPVKKFFRQGGTYDKTTKTIEWTQNGQTDFAVDCQTWVASVLGTKRIDAAFGAGAAYGLWQRTKELAGWNCPSTGKFCGVGYTYNTLSGSILSGEWTYGAINWLRVMIADSGYDAAAIATLQADIDAMNEGIATYLYTQASIRQGSYKSVKYADRRYFIPFGWWANPLPSVASTGWAVLTEANYNPFSVNGGAYYNYASGPAPTGEAPPISISPAPSGTSGPSPSGTSGPSPSGTSGPSPSGTSGPLPSGTSGPSPSGTSGPSPSGTSGPSPSGTSGPLPSGTSGPSPSGTSGPSPSGSSGPSPSGTSGPTGSPGTSSPSGTSGPVNPPPAGTSTQPPSPPRTTWPGDGESAAPGASLVVAAAVALIAVAFAAAL